MKKLGSLFVLISYVTLSLTRPQTEEIKRKFPPPEAGFKSRDAQINMTIDELITLQLGDNQDTASRVMDEGGSILTELDLMLTPKQFAELHPHESDILPNHTLGTRQKRKAERNTDYRWIQAEIPYSFEANTFNTEEQFMILEAMTEWERYTCVKFRKATPSHQNVLYFTNGQGCISQLGMIGGLQALQLQAPGCRFRGLYLHEIGHAIGLIHEHQRPDRDYHIDILQQNVAPALRSQFEKYSSDKVDLVDTIYEYSSVMHYGVTAFSYNGQAKTIRPKDPAREEEIGKVYLKELAFMDVKAVNNMYNCSGNCPSTIKCSNGGYVDENCRCVCPDGSRDCELEYTKPQTNGDCSNAYDDWQCSIWANSGQCHRNRKFMSTSCRKACLLCDSSAAPNGECKDLSPSVKCGGWKERGDCVANEGWMSRNCRKTCNACVNKDKRPETMCENKHSNSTECEQWAGEGECVINRVWMLNNCQSACQYCHRTPPDVGSETSGDCKDLHYDKAACAKWAESGECEANQGWMSENCKKSCGKCSGGGGTGQGDCKDAHQDTAACARWAESGECEANPIWMSANCKKSCGKCSGGGGTNQGDCKDAHQDTAACARWAESGECEANPIWMSANCKKSCGKCSGGGGTNQGDCKDAHQDTAACARWAESGECEANPIWMSANCKKSCGKCSGGGGTDNTPCEDSDPKCPVWADQAECVKNPQWMKTNCRLSCEACNPKPGYTKPTEAPWERSTAGGPCRNLHTNQRDCDIWASSGHCDINPSWMHDMCRKACRLCEEGQVTEKPVCEDLHEDRAACVDWAQTGECQTNPTWMLFNCKKSCGACTSTSKPEKPGCTGVNSGSESMAPFNRIILAVFHILFTLVRKLF